MTERKGNESVDASDEVELVRQKRAEPNKKG